MQVHDSRQPSVKYVKSVLQWKQIMMTFMTSNISFFIHQDKNWLKFCVLCLSSSGTKHYRKWSRDELTQLANSSRPHIPKNVPLPPPPCTSPSPECMGQTPSALLFWKCHSLLRPLVFFNTQGKVWKNLKKQTCTVWLTVFRGRNQQVCTLYSQYKLVMGGDDSQKAFITFKKVRGNKYSCD